MPPPLQLQKLPGKGGGGWKKVSLRLSFFFFFSSFFFFFFFAEQKTASSWKKCVLGHPIHEQQVIACCLTRSDYGPQKMSLKLAV